MIVVVGSLKGGVGKTTAAMHLAACAAGDGAGVVVLDADPERSAGRWAEHAGAALPFRVVPAERDRLAQQAVSIERAGEVVIIDGPPNDRDTLTRAALVAAAVVVPVVPTGLDVDRLLPTLGVLREVEAGRRGERLPAAVLLNRWDARRRLAREAAAALAELPLFDTRIRDLAAYQQAFGGLPAFLAEFRELWREVVE